MPESSTWTGTPGHNGTTGRSIGQASAEVPRGPVVTKAPGASNGPIVPGETISSEAPGGSSRLDNSRESTATNSMKSQVRPRPLAVQVSLLSLGNQLQLIRLEIKDLTTSGTSGGTSETAISGQSTASQSINPGQSTATEPTAPGQSTTSDESIIPEESTTSEPTAIGQSTGSGRIPGQLTTSDPIVPVESTTSESTPRESTTSERFVPGESTTSELVISGEPTIIESVPGRSALTEPVIPGQSTASEPIVSADSSTTQALGVTEPATTNSWPSTTISSLSPGASIIMLTNSTYTSPMWVTTTSPGGGEPTVVSIIIPIKGPPEICFGYYISFSPKIEINTLDFCIRLLASRIGS
ncbi:hypothetical protein B0J13DRAFT_525607 [Dactylonectria estremocensis]|uniref:Uncharacterized protein n=1 Tax=Dactylonectria estremocensis TaxID=1079267 RepID=A0A9P9ETM5_9HYPO|nr:hypothetical protein B0J13DRAFT_525607 [Dactylonectria estremocensis]